MVPSVGSSRLWREEEWLTEHNFYVLRDTSATHPIFLATPAWTDGRTAMLSKKEGTGDIKKKGQKNNTRL